MSILQDHFLLPLNGTFTKALFVTPKRRRAAHVAGEPCACVYCKQLIDVDDDAQRISKCEVAHTACAFAADEAFFFFHFDKELSDETE